MNVYFYQMFSRLRSLEGVPLVILPYVHVSYYDILTGIILSLAFNTSCQTASAQQRRGHANRKVILSEQYFHVLASWKPLKN